MAAYNLVSATASYVIARRNWLEGGWDSNNWNQVGESAILERGLVLAADAYKFESLYPNSNITQTGFTGGFAQIDEATANDTDFAYGSNDLSVTLEVGLTDTVGIKNSSTQNTVTYRYAKADSGVLSGTGNTVTVTASVYEGATLIATDVAQIATGTWQQRTFAFNSSSVINLNNLSIRFTSPASGGAGTTRRGIAISWAKADVSVATYTEAGKDAFFSRKYVVIASVGSFTLTRNPANLIRTRRFIADTGSRTITGIDAILEKGYYLLAAKSTYSTAGGASFGYKGYKVIASTGSFAVTGRTANLFRYARLASDPRAFIISGQTAITKKGFKVTAENGTYTVSGKDNNFRRSYVVTSSTGAISVSGKIAITQKGYRVLGSRGIYVIIGRIALLYRLLIAAKGSIAISGNGANLTTAGYINAAKSTYTVVYRDAGLRKTYRLSADTGIYKVRYSFTYLRYAGYGFLIPDGNITQTGFTGGFADIDEITANDSDFAWSANNTSATLEVSLSNPKFLPINGTALVIYRVAKTDSGVVDGSGAQVFFTPYIYQGATLVATGTQRAGTGTWTQYSFTFDASSVTNWSDLRLRFSVIASGGTGTTRRGLGISWAQVQLPLVASGGEVGVYGGDASFEFGITPYIAASNGSVSVSGNQAQLIRTRISLNDGGSYVITTKSAILARSYLFNSATGVFALTGRPNSFRRGIRLFAAAGTYSYSGNGATLARSRILTASAGVFSVDGKQATLKKGFATIASTGSFAISGKNSTLAYGRRLPCSAGSFNITGRAAVLKKGFRLAGSAGTYAITGIDANFIRQYVFASATGAYQILGNSAQSTGNYALTVNRGQVSIINGTNTFRRSYVTTSTATGSINVTGVNQTLAYGRVRTSQVGSCSITGNASTFRRGYVTIASAGSYLIISGAANWIRGYNFATIRGQVNVSGKAATLSAGFVFYTNTGNIEIDGVLVNLKYKRRRQKMLLIL